MVAGQEDFLDRVFWLELKPQPPFAEESHLITVLDEDLHSAVLPEHYQPPIDLDHLPDPLPALQLDSLQELSLLEVVDTSLGGEESPCPG